VPCVAVGLYEKRGPQNEGKLNDVIENKWRKMSVCWFETILLKTNKL
jgi:hypothetical protein